MSGGGPDGPDAGDGLDGFGGAKWERDRQAVRSAWPRGLWGARILAVADTVAIAVTLTIIAATVVAARPIGGVDRLWGVGLLPVVAGQAFAIALMWAASARRRALGDVRLRRRPADRKPNGLFGPVDRRGTRAAVALGAIGFLASITALIFTYDGTPAAAGGGCLYRLSSHGIFTCVSESSYHLAGAAQQREVAGVFLFFYAMQLFTFVSSGAVRFGGRPEAG